MVMRARGTAYFTNQRGQDRSCTTDTCLCYLPRSPVYIRALERFVDRTTVSAAEDVPAAAPSLPSSGGASGNSPRITMSASCVGTARCDGRRFHGRERIMMARNTLPQDVRGKYAYVNWFEIMVSV